MTFIQFVKNKQKYIAFRVSVMANTLSQKFDDVDEYKWINIQGVLCIIWLFKQDKASRKESTVVKQ